jgi:hypothetical protein
VAADDYDADIASFRFLSLGEFVMAWKVYLPTGTVEVGSADLKRMAASGEIEKSTIVESTTNKVRTQAVGIAGLVFKSEDVNLLDLPIPEVPQTPPTWNPPEDRREAFQEAPWATRKPVAPPRSTIGALFDTSFESMWTPALLGMVWITWLLFAILGFVASLFLAAGTGMDANGVTMVVASLLTSILVTIVVRVTLETIAVIFKICEYLKRLDEKS